MKRDTSAKAIDLLRFALADVPGISAAFVFGSVAQGTAGDQSDVDLFVIAAQADENDARMLDRTLAQRTVEASLGIGREVNVVVLTAAQLARKLASGRAFYTNVVAGPKRWVLGNSGCLRSVQRMAKARPR